MRGAPLSRGLPLSRMQRWMQEVVVHPGEIDQALASPRARAALKGTALEDVILPSRSLRPAVVALAKLTSQ